MIYAAYTFLALSYALYQYIVIGVSLKQKPVRYGIASLIFGQLFLLALCYALYLVANG